MTVYIVQKPKPNRQNWMPDFTTAAQFGDFEFIFEAHHKVFRNTAEAATIADEKLRDFDPQKDYLLWAASEPAAVYAAIMVLIARGHDAIRFLQWNRSGEGQPGYYAPMEIDISHLPDLYEGESK